MNFKGRIYLRNMYNDVFTLAYIKMNVIYNYGQMNIAFQLQIGYVIAKTLQFPATYVCNKPKKKKKTVNRQLPTFILQH